MRVAVWILVLVSGALAYAVALSEFMPSWLRVYCGWYALVVLLCLFAVVAVSLSARFGRLKPEQVWLVRFFDLWS